jgi:hypothetical protein
MNKYIFLIIILLLGLSACDETLENVDPESSLTVQNFWDAPSSAEAAVTGLHDNLRDNNLWYFVLGDLRSEIWGGKTDASPHGMNFIQNDIRKDYGDQAPDRVLDFHHYGGGIWIDFYTFIHRVNDAIKNIPEIEFESQARKDYLLGQVYGMRGFAYYWLMKTYGKVPIVLEPTTAIDKEEVPRERSPIDEVMSLVKSDIQKSLEYFGDDDSFFEANRTYWSKAATLMLKGQVYLWSGMHHGGGDADFTESKNALQEIVNMGHFSLQDDYLSVIQNEQNDEIIYAMDYEEAEQENIFEPMCISWEESFVDSAGNPMPDYNGIYWVGRYGVSDYLRQLIYDHPDDQRGNTFRMIYKIVEGSPSYYSTQMRKFSGTFRIDGNIMDDDVPLYRYAETLLLLAEAKNHLGENVSGEINAIRQRAYGENYNESIHGYTNGSQEENTEAILQENLLEFIGEGKRFWALRRAGDQWVFDKHPYLSENEKYTFYLPLHREVLGRNPKLEQTEGY